MDIRTKFLTVVAGFAVAAVFSACGDDSGSNSSRHEDPSPEVAELELANGKAVVCDDDMEGVVAITADDGYRKCVDGEWIKISKLEAMKADKIIGQLDDDDDDDDDGAGTESSSSQKQSSSSKKSSILDDDDDDNDDVIPSSSSVIPSEVEGSSASKPMEYSAETLEDVPTCTAKREGSTVLVEKTGKKYVCEDGEWLALQSTAKSSSSVIPSSSSGVIPNSSSSVIPSEVEGSSSSKGGSSVIYVCPDGTVVAKQENCKTPSSSSSDTPNTSASETPNTSASETPGTSASETPGSSSGVIPGTDPESPSEVKADGYYSNSENCPAGLTCKYATTTEYLNPDKTYGEILDTRDGQVYKTIEICDKGNKNCQTWMAQNLNYDYNEGTAMSFCYDGLTENCDKFGRLYMWSAAIDSAGIFSMTSKDCGYGASCANRSCVFRGVCPMGWHLPSSSEWDILVSNTGNSNAGINLKTVVGWDDDGNGTNIFGFSVLPAGYGFTYDGAFRYININANYWTSTEDESRNVHHTYFYSSQEYVGIDLDDYYEDGSIYNDFNRFYTFSVRCLKDSRLESSGEEILNEPE